MIGELREGLIALPRRCQPFQHLSKNLSLVVLHRSLAISLRTQWLLVEIVRTLGPLWLLVEIVRGP
jgi:hypothetical protein